MPAFYLWNTSRNMNSSAVACQLKLCLTLSHNHGTHFTCGTHTRIWTPPSSLNPHPSSIVTKTALYVVLQPRSTSYLWNANLNLNLAISILPSFSRTVTKIVLNIVPQPWSIARILHVEHKLESESDHLHLIFLQQNISNTVLNSVLQSKPAFYLWNLNRNVNLAISI